MDTKEIIGISILGSGNVGKRIGSHFEKEYIVIFNDISETVLKELNKEGHICTADINYALYNTNVTFIAVPTPLANNGFDSNGLYDTAYLESVSKDIGTYLKNVNDDRYHIFVIKSTVVPGTTENVVIATIEKYSGMKEGKIFGVVYNPEFLTVIHKTWSEDTHFCIDSNNEGRIVIGEGKNKNAGDIVAGDVVEGIYKKLNPNIPILRTDYKTAEMTKLVANARLALAISFSNELFLMNKELRNKGIDIDEKFIIDSLTLDPRIGKYGSVYGKAWGGPCFLKDTEALRNYLENKTGNPPRLISDLININDEMRKRYGLRE